MQVEFIGLPGAGKTTIRRKLLSDFREEGETRCVSFEEEFLRVARERIDTPMRIPLRWAPHPVALRLLEKLHNRSLMQYEAQNRFLAQHGCALDAFLTSATFQGMSVQDRQRVIGHFLGMGSLWQCMSDFSSKDKIVLFEEGLVQKSFMFVDHNKHGSVDEERVHAYLDCIPRSDLVIHVSASVETSLNRMKTRPDGLTDRLKNSGDREIRNFLESAKTHIDLVQEWLRANRRQSLITMDSEKNDAGEFVALKEKIKAL